MAAQKVCFSVVCSMAFAWGVGRPESLVPPPPPPAPSPSRHGTRPAPRMAPAPAPLFPSPPLSPRHVQQRGVRLRRGVWVLGTLPNTPPLSARLHNVPRMRVIGRCVVAIRRDPTVSLGGASLLVPHKRDDLGGGACGAVQRE